MRKIEGRVMAHRFRVVGRAVYRGGSTGDEERGFEDIQQVLWIGTSNDRL
jgi:hypothetical protein